MCSWSFLVSGIGFCENMPLFIGHILKICTGILFYFPLFLGTMAVFNDFLIFSTVFLAVLAHVNVHRLFRAPSFCLAIVNEWRLLYRRIKYETSQYICFPASHNQRKWKIPLHHNLDLIHPEYLQQSDWSISLFCNCYSNFCKEVTFKLDNWRIITAIMRDSGRN